MIYNTVVNYTMLLGGVIVVLLLSIVCLEYIYRVSVTIRNLHHCSSLCVVLFSILFPAETISHRYSRTKETHKHSES